MKFSLIFLCIIYLKVIESHDSESSEMNRVEITPFYDTVIISDVADIINEFENNMNSPLDAFLNSESESNENVEDLLKEYETYLDKAHKQHLVYLENNKNKGKNKVPPFRHDKFFKGKTPNLKHENYYFNSFLNPSPLKYPQMPQNNFDLFIPLNANEKFLNKPFRDLHKDITPPYSILDKLIKNKLPPMDLQSVFFPDPMKPRCCKNGQVNCKQCLNYNSFSEISADPKLLLDKSLSEIQQDTVRLGNNYINNDVSNDLENTINLKIKIDVQLPSSTNMRKSFKGKYRERMIEPEETYKKEYMSYINLPVPHFNFPIPLDVFGHKKNPKFYKHDNVHEITIHKKKKSRNNNSKKHRNKIISFHKISSPRINITYENNTNVTHSPTEKINMQINISKPIEDNSKSNNTKDLSIKDKNNDTQMEESILVTLNISNKGQLDKEYGHKMIENSIETDYSKSTSNITKEKTLLRRRRDIPSQNITLKSNITVIGLQNFTNLNTTSNKETLHNVTKVADQITSKKIEKSMFADAEMLFWPNSSQNRSVKFAANITNMILDTENKREKFNMSTDSIKLNRTVALEQAIFGNVDWNDVDVVAPTVLSFVGKYLNGALTFCSEKICHSMKCEETKCYHRTCVPEDRFNQKGHCTGSNMTDSVASLESIMDLPSSVVFKIVDILEDKMLGKLFGKTTLCVNVKCLTFLANKKNFIKYKCNSKETITGHCQNVKNGKVI